MWAYAIRFMPHHFRMRRINQLLTRLESWEQEGRDLLAQLLELTDQGDDIHAECARVLDLLDR